MLNVKMLFKIFAVSFGIFSNSVSADECGRAGKWHSSDVCTAVSGCQWCESIGIFPVNARCVTESDALVLTKSFYTCSSPQNKVQSSRVDDDDDDDCDDDDNDLCDLHKRDQAGCMTNPMCTWCVSSGLVPATPDCVLITDAPWIPKQIYTCASKIQVQNKLQIQGEVQTQQQVQSSNLDDDCDDDDNDICDLHKRDQAGCMTNPMCTWCISSGIIPATPDCVLITDAPWIPKQIYTCASKVQSSIQTSFQRTQFEPIIWENAFQKIIKSQPTLKTAEPVQVSSVDDDDDDDDCDDDDSINRYTSCVSLAIKQGLDISVCDSLKNAL